MNAPQPPPFQSRKFPLNAVDVAITSLPATARISYVPGVGDISPRVTAGALIAAGVLFAILFFSGIRKAMTPADIAALFGPLILGSAGFGVWSWLRTTRLARSYLGLTFDRDSVRVVDHDGVNSVEWSEPYRVFLGVLLSEERDDGGYPFVYYIDLIHPKTERCVPLVVTGASDIDALKRRAQIFGALFGLKTHFQVGLDREPLR